MNYKIAVMSDVHGNLPALKAVLNSIKKQECDIIYHLGDAVAIGPYPAECLDILLNTPNLELVMGNHDQWFAYGLPNPLPEWMSKGEIVHHEWLERCVDSKLQQVVADFPYQIKKQYGQFEIVFTHYGFQAQSKQFDSVIKDPQVKDLDAMFAPYQADLVCFGHDHQPTDLTGQARYLNPGSLGCNTAGPTTRYLMLEIKESAYKVNKVHVPYDASDLFKEFKARKVPAWRFIWQTFYSKLDQEASE